MLFIQEDKLFRPKRSTVYEQRDSRVVVYTKQPSILATEITGFLPTINIIIILI